jgi:hypothetical protein
MKLLVLSTCILLSVNTFGAEADHYTDRSASLLDISEQINDQANSALSTAVEKLSNIENCESEKSEQKLYDELRKTFANHTSGKLVKSLLHSKSITKRTIPLNESIFEEWSVLNGYLLGRRSAAKSPLALSPMIQVGDQLVGIDKLEHMFGMGFRYFKKHYLKGKSLKKVLKGGIVSEKTILGGNILATGVFAYGDLAANFNGMRFWNHMLQRRNDVLGVKHNIGPYIKCENGKFEVNEEIAIDFKNYVDSSMDESINCSKFATKSGAKRYKRSVEKRGYSCPMSKDSLNEMIRKYDVVIDSDRKKRPISHWILNKSGKIEDVSYFNEF